MLRARLLVVLLAGSLGLAGGCSSLCNSPWFHRNRPAGPEVIDLGTVSEGPVLDGCAPPNGAALTPQPTVPPLSTPPRLVPQPHSQPLPYTPPPDR
jgi:hypothetical protein